MSQQSNDTNESIEIQQSNDYQQIDQQQQTQQQQQQQQQEEPKRPFNKRSFAKANEDEGLTEAELEFKNYQDYLKTGKVQLTDMDDDFQDGYNEARKKVANEKKIISQYLKNVQSVVPNNKFINLLNKQPSERDPVLETVNNSMLSFAAANKSYFDYEMSKKEALIKKYEEQINTFGSSSSSSSNSNISQKSFKSTPQRQPQQQQQQNEFNLLKEDAVRISPMNHAFLNNCILNPKNTGYTKPTDYHTDPVVNALFGYFTGKYENNRQSGPNDRINLEFIK